MKRDGKANQPEEESGTEQKIKEVNDKYLRALADYQNLEKQTQNWKEEFAKYANSDLIKKLLEVLDDLEKAQDHLQDEGLQIIIGKLQKVLAEEGLEELNLEGREFNPEEAEVVSTEPKEQENIILKVLQKGYKLKDKIIRPARVIVSVKQTNANELETNGNE